jgi:hypothetical protein
MNHQKESANARAFPQLPARPKTIFFHFFNILPPP